MPEKLVVRYCAPTLAGLKTGSLFTYPIEEDFEKELLQWSRRLNEKGIKMLVLGEKKGKALVYVYRPKQLEDDLSLVDTIQILHEKGYEYIELEECIKTLKNRLKKYDVFPHEIGCFLGYPPEDVKGFMKKEKPCKLTGMWKVYGDEKKAKKLFEQYNKCTDIYLKQYEKGVNIERLTVHL